MTTAEMVRPDKLRARLRELEDLRRRVTVQINELQDRLVEMDADVARRRRVRRPACGTDAGYHWHRYNEPDRWPLPVEDPCGCRAAHATRRRVRIQLSREST